MHLVLGSRSERGGARRALDEASYYYFSEVEDEARNFSLFPFPGLPGLNKVFLGISNRHLFYSILKGNLCRPL